MGLFFVVFGGKRLYVISMARRATALLLAASLLVTGQGAKRIEAPRLRAELALVR